MSFQLGIIGGGFVGGATSLLHSDNGVECKIFDLIPEKCVPLGTTFQDILKCQAIFIAVWTPITTTEQEYGKCDTKLVEKIIKQIKDSGYNGYIIIRSTVPVGFCKSQDVYFMPEFLTEKNWKNDFIGCENWIFGTNENQPAEINQQFKEFITNVIQHSSVLNKKVTFVTSSMAEMIKYFRNCFLSVKVSFCNEMFHFANAHNIDYNTLRDLACQDKRINTCHTLVPGHDGLYGFGGHCFPKDAASLQYQMNLVNIRNDIISAAIKRNNEVDRPEKDWL